MSFRIFATCDIGQEALQRLRDKGWELEVYDARRAAAARRSSWRRSRAGSTP